MYEQTDSGKHAARLMIRMQRRAADRPQSPVGHDAMVVWIPAVPPTPEVMMMTHPE